MFAQLSSKLYDQVTARFHTIDKFPTQEKNIIDLLISSILHKTLY